MNEYLFQIIERIFIYLPYIAATLSIFLSLVAFFRTIKERRRLHKEMNEEFNEMENKIKVKLKED